MNVKPKCSYKLSMLAALVLSALSYNANAEKNYTFDDNFIRGSHSKIDLSQYTSSELPEGNYSLDVYTNGKWKGRFDMDVKHKTSGQAGACYNAEALVRFGVLVDKLNKELAADPSRCELLSVWSSDQNVSDTVHKSSMRVDISIPQLYESYRDSNYVGPSLWDEGIPALNLGWTGNVTNSHNSSRYQSDETTGYLGLNARATVGGWSLKHQGNVNWNEKDGTKWDSNQTYLEHPITFINSIASVGQVSSTGEFFDSMRLRGINIRTDTRMFPDSMSTFKPEIRGVAQSNATVTVQQSGKVIYETTVPPGPFLLTDFYPTGYGNDLEVAIKEANGLVTRYTVPYNSGAKLLHPGLFKYELAVGRPDGLSYYDKPVVYQGTAEYGFNNIFTGYAGASGYNDYQSYLLGVGFNTPLGAFSVDVTNAKSKTHYGDEKGNMYRASFSRTIGVTNTTLSMTGAKYDSERFHSLTDTLNRNSGYYGKWRDKKSEASVSINQQFPEGWGAIYANGRLTDYWDKGGREKDYQLSYANSIGNLYYDLSVQRVWTFSNGRDANADTRIGLNFSIPLDFGSNNSGTVISNTVFNNTHYTGTNVGFNGTGGEHHELTYGVSGSNGDSKNASAHAGYRTPYGVVNGSYSQGSDYRRMTLSGNGSVVAHSGGVIFTPESGETLAIVEAKGAEGATINSTLGSTINSDGYAVISTIRPYRVNSVSIDPKGSSDNVYFNETEKQVVPYAGSVVKLTYNTEKQDNLMFSGKLNDGKPFPFGSSVYNTDGKMIGSVGQGGTVFIKDASSTTAKIILETGSCSFTLPKENNKDVICQ